MAIETGTNEDVKALAAEAYALSKIPPDKRTLTDGFKALVILAFATTAATPQVQQEAQNDLYARWGKEIEAQGGTLSPWWAYKHDDGKAPVIAALLASASLNPARPLPEVLAAYSAVDPTQRAALTAPLKAFLARLLQGATSEGRVAFQNVMNERWPHWYEQDVGNVIAPWIVVLPYDGNPPPASLLVNNQGVDYDGGFFDDPTDDSIVEKAKFSFYQKVNDWGPPLLEYNPFALFANAAKGAADFAEGLLTKLAIGAGVVIALFAAFYFLRSK